jgi:hypothetical protein
MDHNASFTLLVFLFLAASVVVSALFVAVDILSAWYRYIGELLQRATSELAKLK